jgi:hypothetical protein
VVPGGSVSIADISFPSAEKMREFAASIGDHWNEEPYWHADEALPALRRAGLNAEYRQISPCAGVFRVECD